VTFATEQPTVERIQLDADAWIDVVRQILPPATADAAHDELAATVAWQQGRVFRYERWIDEPRLSGPPGDGARHPALLEVERWLSRRYRIPFAAPALVRYRDERDGVAWHRDRELRWLDDTVIGVLTLGARRPFLVRPLDGRRDDDLRDAVDLCPASGDLLVMGGACQARWLHAVPKVRQRVRSRISAQWRWTSRRGRRDPNPPYSAPRHFGRR
jgi:alkylated DNA repair dioxygenase AlkB